VHAHMDRLTPGTEYLYRFRYTSGREVGVTPDATFITAPGGVWSKLAPLFSKPRST
jgi:hypothetical protein